MITVRAKFFSANRCAAVAPTFPAPTTATLLSIQMNLAVSNVGGGQRKPPQYSVRKNGTSASDAGAAIGCRSRRMGCGRWQSCGLPDGLVQDDPHSGRKVETPHRSRHRDGEALLRMFLQNALRHSLGLAPEHQT